ncbi:MAG: amidohydrolase family protein [Planctomycetes bacterium]|nr:amidohydrolase family protein [Planctomycetota bacterium]
MIRNARIVTMDGSVIERGSIVIKGGVITEIGAEVKAPLLSRTIDAAGKTVTPGFIDAWSALGRLGGSRHVDATSNAWDAFDRYARDDFREALRRGVTSIYIGAASAPGISGTGVVVQLIPGKGRSAGKVLKEDAALCVDLGSGQKAVARMKTFRDLRKKFLTAQEYRKSLEDYEEDLEEYLKELKKLREEKESAEGDEKDDSESGEEDDGPSEDDEPAPSPDEDEDGDDEGGDEKLGRGYAATHSSDVGSLRIRRRSAEGNGDDDKKDEKSDEKSDEKRREDGEKKDDDELKKPEKPKFDATSKLLLRAIDHELPLRIRAHRSADILNALELADEFNLDIVLEGATDAYLVADRIADADVPVVLGQVVRTDVFERNEFRRHTIRNAAALSKAGVRWTVGSGARDANASRFVAQNAQLAWSRGVRDNMLSSGGPNWMRTVTLDAAAVLGLSSRIGVLKNGAQADLAIWDGVPGDPSSKVVRVLVAGKTAYLAPKSTGGGS